MKTPVPYHHRTPAAQLQARRRAVRMVANGARLTAIALELVVSRQAVYDWREAAAADPQGGLDRKPQGRQCYLSSEQLARLRQMLLEGALAHGFSTDMWTI